MKLDLNVLRTRFGQADGHAKHLVMRISAELEFAKGLSELQPAHSAAWTKLIKKAFAVAEQGAASGDLKALRERVCEAEAILAPLGKAAKSYVIHCVGHGHVDMNWMWSWPETVAVTHDTFVTVLKLMDEYPEFCFSQSQASMYALIRKHHPAMLKRIRQRVAEGRWEVTASHWVEGDKNLANGESLCRHLLYTRQFMKETLGLEPEDVPVDWSPDTFGHAATVPVYLARGGVTYYYGFRFGALGAKRPVVFWWKGPDGSKVLVRNDSAHGYSGVINESLGGRLVQYVKDSGVSDYMYVFGVGDHGGGPTRRDIERGLDMARWPIYPELRFSTSKAYFKKLATYGDKLPTWTGELNFEFTGCYTTQTVIKKANRLGENQVVAAEVAAALDWAGGGRAYPTEQFAECWQDTLFSHFHDILPGSGVHDTRTYTHGLFQKTAASTSMIETLALRNLASRIDTTGVPSKPADPVAPSHLYDGFGAGVGHGTGTGGLPAAEQTCGSGNRPFMVFNPTAHARTEVVVATIWENDPSFGMYATNPPHRLSTAPFHVVTPDSRELPAQMVESGSYWGHHFAKFAFPVEAVPGFGYGLYTLVEGPSSAEPAETVKVLGRQHPCWYVALEQCDFGLENSLVRFKVDPASGGIASLLHKASGIDLVHPARPAAVLEYAVERPHGMSAWSLAETGPVTLFDVLSIEKKTEGTYVCSLEVRLRKGDNTFNVIYELRAGDPNLYMSVNGTWLERGRPERGVPVVRIALPLALSDAHGRYEIPFGAIDRNLNHGEEVPALQWAQVTGKTGNKVAGCLVANDCKYGHSLKDSTLRVTLVRSSYDPDPLPEIGPQGVRLALRPFAGELPVADAVRAGNALNHALRMVGTDVHKGTLPARAGFIAVDAKNLVVCGLKKAETGDALIVRLFETAGRKTTARITTDAEWLGKVASATEVDVLERPLAKSAATATKGAARIVVPAYGLTTVRLTLNR